MQPYTHKNPILPNALIDTSQTITDTSLLQLTPAHDAYHLGTPVPGDFEWWYFDVVDTDTGCVLKITLHLGTDPLKTRIFPLASISIKTPDANHSIMREFSLDDFNGSVAQCEVSIKNVVRVYVEKNGDYRLVIALPEIAGELCFTGFVGGWKPLDDSVTFSKGKKSGTFSWVIPMPRATVHGTFTCRGETYTLNNAIGYHDHNFWKVERKNRLFVDDVVSKWYWGKCFSEEYTIVFMETFFRTHSITSLMIARQDAIIYSANNLIDITADEFTRDTELKSSYPSKMAIDSTDESNRFHMNITAKEIIDKRDLIEDLHPCIRWLIKTLVSRPVYYGIVADARFTIANEKIQGIGIYEYMLFRLSV